MDWAEVLPRPTCPSFGASSATPRATIIDFPRLCLRLRRVFRLGCVEHRMLARKGWLNEFSHRETPVTAADAARRRRGARAADARRDVAGRARDRAGSRCAEALRRGVRSARGAAGFLEPGDRR